MKKLSLVLIAAGLMALAACSKQTPAENITDNSAAAIGNQADALDSAAAAAGNEALANAADGAENTTDAVEDAK